MRIISGPVLGAWVAMLATPYASVALAEPPPTQSEQGTHLHGTGPFEDAHVNLLLEPTKTAKGCQSVTLERGGFKASVPVACTPTDFAGAVFKSEDGTTSFTVQAARLHQNIYRSCDTAPPVDPSLPVDETWEYVVTWSRGNRSGNLCPGNNVALAVPLKWVPGAPPEDWKLIPVEKAFTFACVPQPVRGGCGFQGGGVIAKCVDWGFPPWEHPGATLAGHVLKGSTTANQWLKGDALEAQSFHLACLRMATADYCGVGRSNTLDGTPIAFHDPMYVPLTPPQPVTPGGAPVAANLAAPNEDLAFEAAWVDCRALGKTPGEPLRNTACDTQDKLRLGFGAVCLSKKRWASLPVAGTCFDPSMTQGQSVPDMMGRPCEDYTEAELEALGARFFSYSRHLDTGLYRFSRADGSGASITTTAYVVSPDFPKPGSVTLAPELAGSKPYTYVRFEGAIFSRKLSEDLRNRLQLQGLYRCFSDSDVGRHFFLNTTSTADPKDACALLQGAALDTGGPREPLEGYVSPAKAGVADTALSLWRDGQGHLVTSTIPPDGASVQLRVIGYIPGNN
jgi:hypothetical protein